MQDQEVYGELKKALLELVSLDADEELKTDLNIAVERYFVEQLSGASKEELLRFLESPEKMVKKFKEFLNSMK